VETVGPMSDKSVDDSHVTNMKAESKKPAGRLERRGSSDSPVTKNFSQIFSADSYSELTLVPDTTAIEQTGGFKMRASRLSSELSDSEMSEQESEVSGLSFRLNSQGIVKKSHDIRSESCDSQLESHDTGLQMNDTNEPHDTKFDALDFNHSQNASLDSSTFESTGRSMVPKACDYSGSFSDSESTRKERSSGIPRLHGLSRDLHGATLFQRSHRSVLMNFNMRKKFGSTASLPETVGIPEANETEGSSPDVSTAEVTDASGGKGGKDE